MSTPRAAQHRDLTERIKKMEGQIQQLLSAQLTRPASKVGGGSDLVVEDGGRLIVKHPGNVADGMTFGPRTVTIGGTPTYYGTGLLVRDAAGKEVAYLGSNPIGGERLALRDASGNLLTADDGNTGYGLAIPYLHFTMYPAPAGSAVTTTSTSFATLWAGRIQYVAPWLRMIVAGTLSGATGGQLRVLLDGEVVAVADFTANGQEVTLETSLHDRGKTTTTTGTVLLQGRVSVGSGTIGALPRALHGRQS